MANEMPSSDKYTGLSRKVLEYSEHFSRIVAKIKAQQSADAEWPAMEKLVDVENFRRVGVFLTNTVETSTWSQYKNLIGQYGGMTEWEGTLRRITETPGLVFLELEERNTRNGITDIANTVTIYRFNQANKLAQLDVYVGHVGQRASSHA
jgi:hypothetical protein